MLDCVFQQGTGDGATTASTPAPSAQYAENVRLAMPGDYAPMSTLTEKHELTGFEWDLMNAIGREEQFIVDSILIWTTKKWKCRH